MEIGKHEYKGIEVWYEDWDESWTCELNDRSVSKEKIADIRKRIDTFVKVEKKFERFEAIYLGRGSFRGLRFGTVVTVTSRTEDGEYWISGPEGRSREHASSLCHNDTSGREIVASVTSKRKRIDEIQAEVDELLESAGLK